MTLKPGSIVGNAKVAVANVAHSARIIKPNVNCLSDSDNYFSGTKFAFDRI